MPIDFGTGAAVEAGNLGLGMQRQNLANSERNDKAIQDNLGSSQKQTEFNQELEQKQGEINQQHQKIKIDKQLAEGLGDPNLEGTSMDPKIFGALSHIQGAAKYHADLISDKDKLAELSSQAKQKLQDSEDKAKADRQDKEDKAKADREEKALKNKKDLQDKKDKAKGGPKGDPDKAFKKRYAGYENDLKGMSGTMLSDMAKTDPEKAKELQEKQAYLQKYKGEYDKSTSPAEDATAGNDKSSQDDQKISDYIKKNGIKDTPANRAWAKTKING